MNRVGGRGGQTWRVKKTKSTNAVRYYDTCSEKIKATAPNTSSNNVHTSEGEGGGGREGPRRARLPTTDRPPTILLILIGIFFVFMPRGKMKTAQHVSPAALATNNADLM